MSLNTDIVKIKMVKEGYLPNYPPHMISDDEMCDAFLPLDYPFTDTEWNLFLTDSKLSMFRDYYVMPNLIRRDNSTFEPAYRALVSGIAKELKAYRESLDPDKALPNWVLSYMNHSTISNSSDYLDLDGLLTLLGIDMIEPEFTVNAYEMCYRISTDWLRKTDNTNRPATIFGEPHVIKYLRLQQSNIMRKR